MALSDDLLAANGRLNRKLGKLKFSEPVTHVYNPLVYAKKPHKAYLTRYGNSKKKVLMMGMNPGPWGMAQTGVPFGEIPAVRDWMGIREPVAKPKNEHPKRPIVGFDCDKSEVSGRRLWGLFAERFESAEAFFADHFVVNYCPLAFMEESGKNRTPDKLPKEEQSPVNAACDEFIAKHFDLLEPEWLIGVGAYAEAALTRVAKEVGYKAKINRVLHPSPASPLANRGWSEAATKQLVTMGLWD